MKHKFYPNSILLLALFVCLVFFNADSTGQSQSEDTKQKLAVIWTSGDPDVAHRVCFMYTHAAKKAGWFDEVILVVWGPSARLLAGDKDLQAKISDMKKDGVIVQACVNCANSYGVSQNLSDMGIEVKGMGQPLTDMLKSDWKVITF